MKGRQHDTERCALCGMRLGVYWVEFSEGRFCQDDAGCRRRALQIVERLRGSFESGNTGGTQ